MTDDPNVPVGDSPGLAEQTCINCGSTQLTQDTDGVWHCGYCRSTFRAADPAMIVVSTPNVQQSDERVIDTGDLFTHDQQQRLSDHLRSIQAEHDVVVVVETVNTITENVERYARRRAQDLGVGDDAKDNGLYILLVREPRRFQVQAGNGISTHLGPDDIDRVVREDAVPLLKADDIAGGVIAGANGLVALWRSNRDAGIVRTSSVAAADDRPTTNRWANTRPRSFASADGDSGSSGSGSDRSKTTSPLAVLFIIAMVIFFIFTQRHIVNGLLAGSVKG